MATPAATIHYARIGLKGETQINDQLIGYGQWEYNMDASNVEGSQTTKTRLAFAGLKAGEYGSFDYGRNYGARSTSRSGNRYAG